MAEKRIFIIEVNGDCRNIRYIPNKPGKPDVYCAANLHSDWELIDPEDCKTCKREKYLEGISRQEAIKRMRHADVMVCRTAVDIGKELTAEERYGAMLNALLGKEAE